jgi:hypothetical protein
MGPRLLSSLFVVLLACGTTDTDTSGSGAGGGSGNVPDGTTLKAEDSGPPDDDSPPSAGGGSLGPADCSDAPTELSMLPEQLGFLAGGQYVADMLAAGVSPAPEALQVEDLEPYFLDAASSAPVSLSARVSSGRWVLEGFSPAAGDEAGPVDLVVVVDVSPSNSTTIALRDAVLDTLAASLEPGSTLSIVAFANEAQVILESAPQEFASAEVARTRSFLAPKEGHDLARALKTATAVGSPDDAGTVGEATRHYLVLTDAGFLPDESSLDVARALAKEGGAVSIAQLARSPLETGVAPALRSDTLRAVAAAGGGVGLFLTSPARLDADFARWFSPRVDVPTLVFGLPAGLDADLDAIPGVKSESDVVGGELLTWLDNPNLAHHADLPVKASCEPFEGAPVSFGGAPFVLTTTDSGELSVEGDALPQARERLAGALAALRKNPTARCAALTELASAPPECEVGTRACTYQEAAFELLITDALEPLCSLTPGDP